MLSLIHISKDALDEIFKEYLSVKERRRLGNTSKAMTALLNQLFPSIRSQERAMAMFVSVEGVKLDSTFAMDLVLNAQIRNHAFTTWIRENRVSIDAGGFYTTLIPTNTWVMQLPAGRWADRIRIKLWDQPTVDCVDEDTMSIRKVKKEFISLAYCGSALDARP
jgi:hypothetical protein